MNIVLSGFMGTGKTAVGKELGKRLNMIVVDTDTVIEQRAGMTVSNIFASKGEPEFRKLESEVIFDLAQRDTQVITLGGGAVLRAENMYNLEYNGVVVCLTARAEVIYNRIKNDTARPLLQKPDPLAEITRLLSARESYYKRCRTMVDTSELTVKEVVDKIAEYLKK
ncbi:MAG: shikimate kinase [Elusimicrobiota bacterium]